jgi:predicted metalloprotease with PDZ domain
MRCLIVAALTLAFGSSFAEISYTVTPNPEANRLGFAVSFDAKGSSVDVQLPKWAPGSYRLFNPGISDLRADRAGAGLAVSKVDDNTWRIASGSNGPVTVTYSAQMRMNDGAVHMTGPHNYVYVVGRIKEQCNLKVALPDNWRIAVGLDEKNGGWTAPDYDVLADNPITMGDFLMDTYVVKNIPHYIVLYGTGREFVDRPRLAKYCEDITRAESHFFGGDIPYKKYVWHFNVNTGMDGAGGLEHLSSTSISLAAGVGPRAVSVLSHEFFHLWNVKRIRSVPLGPFNYQELPKTGALWWLEGVTDYYASLLLHRYGILPEKYIYEDIVSNFRGYDSHPQRNNINPHEASMRVGETNNGRGNSNGYLMSYYTMGWVAGLCLDIELRRLTNNRHTLDDVMLSLYQTSGLPKPGFEEGEIRNQFVRLGGVAMGTYYDRIVHENGGIDVREALAKIGLQIEQLDERYKDVGFEFTGSDGAIQIRRDAGELKRGDRIKRIGSVYLGDLNPVQAAKQAREALDAAPAGVPIALDYAGDEEATVMVTPQLRVRTATKVTKVAGPTTEQVMLREALLRTRSVPRG